MIGSATAAMDAPLMEFGLDSLGAVELRNSLASRFSVELPPTVTLDYPTIVALAQFISTLIAPASRSRKAKLGRRVKGIGSSAPQAVDIVGVSCVYPGIILDYFCLALNYITLLAKGACMPWKESWSSHTEQLHNGVVKVQSFPAIQYASLLELYTTNSSRSSIQ